MNAVVPKFVLGTAQLGMDYGRVNRTGKPPRQAAIKMLRHAIAHGVTLLDTARAYGEGEGLIGEALAESWRSRVTVITKLDLSGVDEGTAPSDVYARVDASIEASCCALRTEKLNTLLLHNWAHHDMWRGAAWLRLREHQAAGKISKLGASVYRPHEALAALGDPAIQQLQIPTNVLDWRWKPLHQAFAQRPDVIVHARSSLLQGILAHPAVRWPIVSGFDAEGCVRKLQAFADKFHRDGVADLCLAYVRSLPWSTSVVVGCETIDQLEQNIELFARPTLQPEVIQELEDALPRAPEDLLNPEKWDRIQEKVARAS
jgi:aryl-alcohol dehydrogenase-like predicted oxidoreductase